MKRYLFILIALLFSLSACQQSSFDEINEQMNEPEFTTDAAPETTPLFNQSGLDRVIDYLQYSKQAFKMSESFASLLREIVPHYDWKQTKPYLRGGDQDPIGKLLSILAVDRFPNRAYEGLIQIVKNKELLKELIDFFTSDLILDDKLKKSVKEAFSSKKSDSLKSSEVLIDTFTSNLFLDKNLRKSFGNAFKSKKLDIRELAITAIYKAVIKKFGSHYHINSEWEEDTDQLNTYKLKNSGFSEQQIKLLLLETNIMRMGNVRIMQIIGPSKNITFFTNLIFKYYDFKRPKPDPEEKKEEGKKAEGDDEDKSEKDEKN